MKIKKWYTEECDQCNNGWDEQCDDKCDHCGGNVTIEDYHIVEVKDVPAYIERLLGKSWNGTAINGTPYTQWDANEDFFSLWKVHKDEIKSHQYTLYKHDTMGWVVTFFGDQHGTHASYEEAQEVTA